jgi:hypothetical protein
MTNAPETAEFPDPALPRDPAEYSLRRRGFGATFWAMIALSVLSVLSGVAIAHFGPRLFPLHKTADAPAATSETPVPPSAPVAPPPAPAPSPAAAVAAPSSPEVAALGARIDRLQAGQRRIADASAEALAAADLSEAAQASLPFADHLASLDRLLPDSPDLRALRALAQTGAPSRAALAAQFAGVADRAAVAAHAPPAGSSLLVRAAHALAGIFTVRRVDQTSGDGPDAVLARAQRHADDGDIEGALKELNALPPGGAKILAGWRGQAERRAEIDRIVAAIRSGAVRDLADAERGPAS